jgi:hypothetical protein
MGRHLSSDALYARELGLVGRNSKRTIKILGGEAKLRSLSPEVREVLLRRGNRDKDEIIREEV